MSGGPPVRYEIRLVGPLWLSRLDIDVGMSVISVHSDYAAVHCAIMWSMEISTVSTVPCTAPTAGNLPAVRTVQRDCEIVYWGVSQSNHLRPKYSRLSLVAWTCLSHGDVMDVFNLKESSHTINHRPYYSLLLTILTSSENLLAHSKTFGEWTASSTALSNAL